MPVTSYFRGHPIYYSNKGWRYEDNLNLMEGVKPRPCKKCGKKFAAQGVADPCLGDLPGVKKACCGHGIREKAYVMFTNGVVIRGFEIDKG